MLMFGLDDPEGLFQRKWFCDFKMADTELENTHTATSHANADRAVPKHKTALENKSFPQITSLGSVHQNTGLQVYKHQPHTPDKVQPVASLAFLCEFSSHFCGWVHTNLLQSAVSCYGQV